MFFNRNIFSFWLIILFSLSANFFATAQISIPTGNYRENVIAAVPFLLAVPDAYVSSLGDAGVAAKPNYYSIWHNSAAAVFASDTFGLGIAYSDFDIGHSGNPFLAGAGGYFKLNENNGICAGLRYNRFNIPLSMTGGSNIGTFVEYTADAAYARKLSPDFSAGIGIKYVHSNGLFSDGSVAFDVSMFYKNDQTFFNKDASLTAGLHISDIGEKMWYSDPLLKDYLPANLAVGSSYSIALNANHLFAFYGELNKLLIPTPDSSDLNNNNLFDFKEKTLINSIITSLGDDSLKEEFEEITLGTVVEYIFAETIRFNLGFFYEYQAKGARQFYSVGAGFLSKHIGVDICFLFPTNLQNNPLSKTFKAGVYLR